MSMMAVFASSFICEFFSTVKLQKIHYLGNRITNEHLSSVFRISTSQMEPDLDEMLKELPLFRFSILRQ